MCEGLCNDSDSMIQVVSHIPDNISTPVGELLNRSHARIERSVLMMQKEVAERIVAEPNCKAYGILIVQTQLLVQPKMLFSVSRHVFRPKPDVESAVISLDFDAAYEEECEGTCFV